MFDAPLPATLSVVTAADAAAATLWEAAERFDTWDADLEAMMQPVRDAGLFVACLPSCEGGSGLATESVCAGDLEAVLRRIGGASLPAGRLFEGHVNAVKLVFRHGAPEATSAFGEDVRSGAISGVWNAERLGGLVLERPDGSAILKGEKIYCSGAGWLSRPVVTARTPTGPVMAAPRWRPAMRADLSTWTASGMRATATGTVSFEDVALAQDEVIGGPGDYLASPGFKGGAWRFCAVQLGGAERLFALLVQHLNARGRNGDPAQRMRVGRAAVVVGTARLWVSSARLAAESPQAGAEAEAYVNLARTAVETACGELLQVVERSVGLEARMGGSPIERVSRDLATYLRQPFPDAALDEAVAARLAAADASPHADWST